MEFEVLGPVRVRRADETASLSPKARTLLAVLLSRAGVAVSVDVLVDALWEGQRVDNAKQKLQLHVHQLRKALGDSERVRHASKAYTLTVLPGELDAERFESLAAEARESVAGGDPRRGCELFRKALALWRGEPYTGGGDSLSVSNEAQRLSGLRLTVTEELYAAELASGRHAEIVPELDDAVRQHPLHEGLRALAMTALYRSGRAADALRVYREGWQALVDELGLEPGPQLRSVEAAILAGEDVDLGGAEDETQLAVRAVRPAQLPPDLSLFTGRSGHLATLVALGREAADGAGGSVRVAALDGMAGVGKTSLVVHAAHALASDFPDGQIFLDLNGFTDGAEPVTPAEALDRLLRSLGVPSEQIPPDPSDRSALWRSLAADQRLLLVLDDAASEAQVRPLLPAAPGCLVLVTSRRRLSGLDDALLISLDVLSVAAAAELFAGAVGPGRIPEGSAGLVEEVVDLCGRLPLAVRIAAARLRDRPTWRLGDLVRRLRNQHEMLDALEAGDRSVAGAFQLSYEQLDETSRRTFRRLGLHSAPDIDVSAAAALADLPPRTASRILDKMLGVHLLEQHTPDRYQLHGLLRGYAARLGEEADSYSSRRNVVERLLTYYLAGARSAVESVSPGSLRPSEAASIPDRERFSDRERALSWLAAEHCNIVVGAAEALRYDLPELTIALSDAMYNYLRDRRDFPAGLRLHGLALEAAKRVDDKGAEGRALRLQAGVHYHMGEHQVAAELCEDAIALLELADDQVGLYDALCQAAAIDLYRGCLDECRAQLDRAQRLDLEPGSVPPRHVARLLSVSSYYCREVGDYESALRHSRALVKTSVDLGPGFCAQAWNGHGSTLLLMGRYDECVEALSNSARLYAEAGDRAGESLAVNQIGTAQREAGHPDLALDRHRSAMSIAQEIGDDNALLESHMELGTSLLATGELDEPLHHLWRARALAESLDQQSDVARTLDRLGQTYRARGEIDLAREHWQRALEAMTEIGLPDADRIRENLAALDQQAT